MVVRFGKVVQVQYPAFVRQTKIIMPSTNYHQAGGLLWHSNSSVVHDSMLAGEEQDKVRQHQNFHHEQKSSHTWSFPKRSIVVVELLERAKVGVVVVDDLLESGIASAANNLEVFARQMAHRPPVLHVLVAASGHSRREQRGEHEKLHGGERMQQAKERATALEDRQQLLQHSSDGDVLHYLYISQHRDGRHICPAARDCLHAVDPLEDASCHLGYSGAMLK